MLAVSQARFENSFLFICNFFKFSRKNFQKEPSGFFNANIVFTMDQDGGEHLVPKNSTAKDGNAQNVLESVNTQGLRLFNKFFDQLC